MQQWRDVTSYRRDEARVPRSWSLNIYKLLLRISSHHIEHPDQWVLTCEPFFRNKEIGATTHPAEVMQAHAIDLIQRELDSCQRALEAK